MNFGTLITNPWIGVAGTIFGLASIILSVILLFKGRRIAKPCYAKTSTRWFDSKDIPHEDLQLQFRGRTVSRFTFTHLAFWNAGNVTIRLSDFAPASPLRLSIADDIEIFDIRLIAATSPEIMARIESSAPLPKGPRSPIPVLFDYLDHEDGFVIQLIHDGDSHKGIRLEGKLPGVHEFKSASLLTGTAYPFTRHAAQKPFSYMPPFMRYVFVPLTCMPLGSVGLLSVYWAIFREFHWYQILGAFFLVYFIVPFLMFKEITPPRALCDAVTLAGIEKE